MCATYHLVLFLFISSLCFWKMHVHSFVQKSPGENICNLSLKHFKLLLCYLSGDNSSSDRDKSSDEFSEMDETLNSNEESTGDANENKTETSGDTEVSHGRYPTQTVRECRSSCAD